VNIYLTTLTCLTFFIASPALLAVEESKGGDSRPHACLAESRDRDLLTVGEVIKDILPQHNAAFLEAMRSLCTGFSEKTLEAIESNRKALMAACKAKVSPDKHPLIDRMLRSHEEDVYAFISDLVLTNSQVINEHTEKSLSNNIAVFMGNLDYLREATSGAAHGAASGVGGCGKTG
jgi:hypothetical protein